MPKRKYESFGPLFLRITKRSIELMQGRAIGSEPLLKVELKTSGEALNARMQLNQFWASALAAGNTPGRLSSTDPIFPLLPYIPLLAARSPKDQKNVLEIVHRDQLQVSKALATALNSLEEAMLGQVNLEPVLPRTQVQSKDVKEIQRLTGGESQEDILAQVYGAGAERAGSGPQGGQGGNDNGKKEKV